MNRLTPDIQEMERLTTLLILGEILTKRGEPGPLARVWRPAGPRRPRRLPKGRSRGSREKTE